MVIMIAPIFGPIIGGWITDNLSWPWLFYINLPVGAFSAIASWSILRHRESNIVKLPIDVVGLALLVVGVGSLQFMLDNGNEKDWFNSPVILAAAATAIVAIAFLHSLGTHRQASSGGSALVRQAQFSRRHRDAGVWPSSPSRASTSFFRCGCKPRWAIPRRGRDWRSRRSGFWASSSRRSSGRNMMRMNLRLAASFAFCIFGFAVFWTATLNEAANLRAICDAAIPARPWHGIFLPAVESNPDVRASPRTSWPRPPA